VALEVVVVSGAARGESLDMIEDPIEETRDLARIDSIEVQDLKGIQDL
jgi:hypothetical protein